jgi:hypothetical protein
MLAMSVPGVLGLVVLTILLVGFIAWLLPRPDGSYPVRHLSDDRTDRRSPG